MLHQHFQRFCTIQKLGEETIVTKGTLTGVISRLEDKRLVQRVASETDGRNQIIRLTEAGNALFERTFPEHMLFINRLFIAAKFIRPIQKTR